MESGQFSELAQLDEAQAQLGCVFVKREDVFCADVVSSGAKQSW
jgi:hypothetical protein